MKRYLALLLLLLVVTTAAKANGIKLYVGSATAVDSDKNVYYLQLIVCNNTTDTVFIPDSRLTLVQPTITNDLTLITEGQCFFMLHNVPDLIADLTDLGKPPLPPENISAPIVSELDKKRKQENSRLPQREVASENCYVFAPNQCLTINCLVMTFPPEFLKLNKITAQQADWMEVNMIVPIEYYTNKSNNDKDMLLISRTSDDLKNCILKSSNKK